jgi:hypothetical protein
MPNYTPNEWKRYLNITNNTIGKIAPEAAESLPPTLETSGEDVKLHSKRVEKM